MKLIDKAYSKSVALLLDNSTIDGFVAASESPQALMRNYYAIFGRDAMICSLAALQSENRHLLLTAKRSLVTLAKNISSHGQIPFAVDKQRKINVYRFPQSVDGSVWWLIVFDFYVKKTKDKNFYEQYKNVRQKVVTWLETRQTFSLIEQGEAADWADEMPRSGFVLYTNALYLWWLNINCHPHRQLAYKSFLYFLTGGRVPRAGYEKLDKFFPHFRKNSRRLIKSRDYFLAAISRVSFDDSFDVLGNILAGISGQLENNRARKIIKRILTAQANQPYPVRVLARPIVKPEQGIFESYHQNKPWYYHNAGVWPMAGGWWVYLLAQVKNPLATAELERLAEVNQKNNWQFNEFFHGQTGQALGVKHQSWNAATYILAYQAVINKTFIKNPPS